MCGRFSLLDLADFIALFPWVAPPETFAPRYNISPSQPILILGNRSGGTLDHAIWGLVPNWVRPSAERPRTLINARCESVAQKPIFRSSLRYKRCIVPASGFYEWQKSGRPRQPYYITLPDRRPMLFAGLWEDTHDGAGGEIRTACVITTPANDFMTGIHNRMPAILPPEAAMSWIKAPDAEAQALTSLLRPYAGEMQKIPVSPLVNNPANDRRECIESMTAGDERSSAGLFG